MAALMAGETLTGLAASLVAWAQTAYFTREASPVFAPAGCVGVELATPGIAWGLGTDREPGGMLDFLRPWPR
jgi:hypothetical protein